MLLFEARVKKSPLAEDFEIAKADGLYEESTMLVECEETKPKKPASKALDAEATIRMDDQMIADIDRAERMLNNPQKGMKH